MVEKSFTYLMKSLVASFLFRGFFDDKNLKINYLRELSYLLTYVYSNVYYV